MDWSLAGVQDVVAAAVPEREMLVWNNTRRTYAEVHRRTSGLARFLTRQGLGARRERAELSRWECGQSPVGLVLHNCPEYIESMLGCYRARAVPFNVNHHYAPPEIGALFDMVGAEAIVYHRALGPLLAAALPGDRPLLIDVDDGSSVPALEGSTSFETAVAEPGGAATPTPSADDLYMVCTGGTTGSPKAVLWRQADIFVSGMGGTETTTEDALRQTALAGGGSWFAAPPLMHAAAQWTAFAGLHCGGTVVLHDDSKPFDARAIVEVAERERVSIISMVGDAYARPFIEELRRAPHDLTALQRIGIGGATTSDESKDALLELLPQVLILDGYGASETGGMAFGARTKTTTSQGFAPSTGAIVLAADRTRVLSPGDDEIGWTARAGRVPLGYLGDPAKTETTFPIVEGQRLAVPGDRATLDADGTIRMLGRDALVVNTGGEKVFVEEVEQAILLHPDVVDVLVVGRPNDRFGQEVVAIVQTRDRVTMTAEQIREVATRSIARFKAPRAVAFCAQIGRQATGKPDYQWARVAAEAAVPASL